MKKQPRLSPAFVALSLFLASGPLPAAAQMRAQIGAASSTRIPVAPVINGGIMPSAGVLTNTPAMIGLDGSLAAPSVTPSPLDSAVPSAATHDNAKALAIRAPGAANIPASAAKGVADPILDTLRGRPAAAVSFDGGSDRPRMSLQEQIPASFSSHEGPANFRRPDWEASQKIETALRWARNQSPAARDIDAEFARKGGSFQIDDNRNADYFGATVGTALNPSILLTWDVLWRVIQGQYKGAPWEFIASIIAREQTLSSDWYSDIPNSADKLGAAWMTSAKVFVELTGGNARSWATDKDFRVNQSDSSSFLMWNTFDKALAAARDASRSGLHINETVFFNWIADTMARRVTNDPAYQFSLWEMHDGKYYRPGDSRNGQPIPAHIPRISRATFDAASQKVYGNDGKGQNSNQNVFGMIIEWFRGRGEL